MFVKSNYSQRNKIPVAKYNAILVLIPSSRTKLVIWLADPRKSFDLSEGAVSRKTFIASNAEFVDNLLIYINVYAPLRKSCNNFIFEENSFVHFFFNFEVIKDAY